MIFPIFPSKPKCVKMARMERAMIDISELSTPPEKHELNTAHFFSEMGKEIKFIRPSNVPDFHRGDFVMNGIEWEVKSPKGKGDRTIVKLYSKAATQADNIIFDLRRCAVPEKQAISQLEKLREQKHTKRLLIITKAGALIEIPENCLDK